MAASEDAPRGATAPPSPDLGAALRARAGDVAERVVRLWREDAPTRAESAAAVEADVRASTTAGTLAVAAYLATGEAPERASGRGTSVRSWAALGVVTLPEVIKLSLRWREALGGAVREEADRLGSPPAELEAALGAVEAAYDLSVLRTTRRFEATRDELEDQLDQDRARLEHLALHDPLTGLANRALALDRVAHALGKTARGAQRPALLFMDLDFFKAVNDTAGHAAGDDLLVAVAARLASEVRPSDTLARLGGDEFVVLLEDLDDPAGEGVELAGRLLRRLGAPFEVAGREVFVAASVGVAAAGEGDTAEQLLARADQAMYRAKQLGRGRVELYDPAADRQATRAALLATALHRAVAEDQLGLVYQPVLGLDPHRLLAREALLRWRHPALGAVAPTEFVPVAEQTGLIVEIGRWVLRRACADCARWRAEGEPEVRVAVNVSSRQLESPRFEAEVAAALEETGLAPDGLALEVTETVLMSSRPGVRTVLERLRARGVRIAVDDFGNGYSSLSALTRLGVDVLKVDRTFVASLGHVERETVILGAMVHLAHTLGLLLVAKGVETDAQLERVAALGCDAAQGYLLGYPEPLRPADRVERRVGALGRTGPAPAAG